MSDRTARLVGLYASVAAAIAVVTAPLLAMSYFATSEGAKYLEGTVAAWAEPGRDLVGGMVTWASADRVYATYTQVFALIVPAMFLCAFAVWRRRPPERTRNERWGWGIALFGYGLAAVGLFVAAIGLIAGPPSAAVNVAFLSLMLPGMLISLIGSTVLGIGLLRARFTPTATAWLLALAIPGMVLGSVVLGHNSLGMLPLMVAWGVAGFGLWREGVVDAGVAGASLES